MAYPDPPATPPIPQRGDRATFSSRVDAFLMWVAAVIPWLEGFIEDFKATLTTLAAGGANSFGYRFSNVTTDGDPGPGFLRLGSSTQSDSTVLRIDGFDRNNVDISPVVTSVLSSTSSIRGTVRIQKVNEPNSWMLFDITGSTSASGYFNLSIALRASTNSSPFSNNDNLVVFIQRNGDRGDSGDISYAKFSDKKATGTPGGAGAAVVNTTIDRVLNSTDSNSISGASLTGSSFTLPAGTYDVAAHAPIYGITNSRLSLYNVTDSAAAIYGSNGLSTSSEQYDCVLSGLIVITSPKVFKLQQFFTNNLSSTNTLGIAVTQAGVMETYAEIVIRKIK